MQYVEFCLKANRTSLGGLSVIDVVAKEVKSPTPLKAMEVGGELASAKSDSSEPTYSICFTVPFADDHLQIATEAAIGLGLDPRELIDVCAKAEVVSFDGSCPLCSQDGSLIGQPQEYTLVYLEVHRRLSDGKLAIVGMHKTSVEEAFELSIDDFADLPFASGKIARGTAYLFRYTSVREERWDYRESWNQIQQETLENLLIDPLEIYGISWSSEALWESDDHAICIEVEPTFESMALAWAKRNRPEITPSQGERHDAGVR